MGYMYIFLNQKSDQSLLNELSSKFCATTRKQYYLTGIYVTCHIIERPAIQLGHFRVGSGLGEIHKIDSSDVLGRARVPGGRCMHGLHSLR